MRNSVFRVFALYMLATFFAGTAHAQAPAAATYPTWEVSGGYQFLHRPDQSFPFGLNLDGAWNVSSPLGWVGEIGWAMDSEDEGDVESSAHFWNIGAGPRWTARQHATIWPYAQVLAGIVHARFSTTVAGVDFDDNATKFMLQPGAGVNVTIADGLGFVGAVDYRRVFLDEEEDGESGENQFRVFVGLRLLLD